MKDYQIEKALLLQQWISSQGGGRINLFRKNFFANDWSFGNELMKFLEERSAEECIYILVTDIEKEIVPFYIGKSNNVLSRWQSHLNNFFKSERKKLYQQWWERLVKDECFSFDVDLMVFTQSQILTSPIPKFPTSVGTVEYQLVGLASDAYSEYLLNKEGNRR